MEAQTLSPSSWPSGHCAAQLPAYALSEVPAAFVTAAELRADGLCPGSDVSAWQVEFTGAGPCLHTPLYEREKSFQPSQCLTERDMGLQEARSWAKWDLHRGQIMGIRTAVCCGRMTEVAVVDLDGRVLCCEELAAPDDAVCDICRDDHSGLPWEESYERFRRVMGPRQNKRTLIGWGLADALALEVLVAKARKLPQQRNRMNPSTQWEDAQQREARGRVAWTGAGYQHACFPHEMRAVDRCWATLAMIRALRARRERSKDLAVPILAEPVGPLVEYGVVTLPRELSLLPPPPPQQSAASRGPFQATRSTFVPVEQRHTDRSTWRAPEAERTLERCESALVRAFARHLRGLGHEVGSNRIQTDGGRVLRTDVFDRTVGVLYEAKASVEERDFRMAIGQLADYRARLGIPGLRRAVLVPSKPEQDWLDILDGEGIAVAYRKGDQFEATTQLW
ncbi:hypothetical protein [Actinocorallia aurantiaca]|uniref:Uncharacterized protein n=1 Tax=Actinocorallia aurantiaca TaxID=46204 RepID=A0ABN3UNG5_9ACTN